MIVLERKGMDTSSQYSPTYYYLVPDTSLPCWEAVRTLELYPVSWDGASSTETEIAPDLLCVAL